MKKEGEKREPSTYRNACSPIRGSGSRLYDGSPCRNLISPWAGIRYYIGSRKPASPWLSPRRVPRVAASMPMARTPYWMKHSVASETRLPGENSGRRATHDACDTGARKHDPATALCCCNCNCNCYYYHWPSCDAARLDDACSGSIHRARINYYKQRVDSAH